MTSLALISQPTTFRRRRLRSLDSRTRREGPGLELHFIFGADLAKGRKEGDREEGDRFRSDCRATFLMRRCTEIPLAGEPWPWRGIDPFAQSR